MKLAIQIERRMLVGWKKGPVELLYSGALPDPERRAAMVIVRTHKEAWAWAEQMIASMPHHSQRRIVDCFLIQAGADPEKDCALDDLRKYRAGASLTFNAYVEIGVQMEEYESVGEFWSRARASDPWVLPFRRGDQLRVNDVGSGMGINVTRISDGVHDMVWPEEVSITRRLS